MFTGIVQQTAPIIAISRRAGGASMRVENPWGTPPGPGESISADGSCLTVVSANEREISFDISEETLKKTVFLQARPGTRVNLERSLKVGDDLSGHLVTGHVDGVGRVLDSKRAGAFGELSVRVPRELAVYLVAKGCVAVNGVSLTIASLEGDSFAAAVIPETLARTNLGRLKPGDPVNIETDLVGKHVVRCLSVSSPGDSRPPAPGDARPAASTDQAERLSLKGLEEIGY